MQIVQGSKNLIVSGQAECVHAIQFTSCFCSYPFLSWHWSAETQCQYQQWYEKFSGMPARLEPVGGLDLRMRAALMVHKSLKVLQLPYKQLLMFITLIIVLAREEKSWHPTGLERKCIIQLS